MLAAWRDIDYLKNQFFQWVRFRVASRILRAMFLFRRQGFCYHHMLSQPVKICFLIIHTEVHSWRHFSLLVELVILFILVIIILIFHALNAYL